MQIPSTNTPSESRSSGSTGTASSPSAPVARTVPGTVSIHGNDLRDDYAWLKQKDEPAVAEYLEQENAYAEAFLAHTRPLQEKLYQEMLGRIKETDLSVPYRKGEYFYYARTEAGKQY